MPFNAQGQWVPENDSVASRVTDLTGSNNPYILKARADGTASANRRGLVNSSMAAGASEGAAISAALPIASQDAQQVAQKNLTYQQGGYDMNRQGMVTASADRNASLSAALASNQNYLTAFGEIANNKDIPAATRDIYLQHLLDTRSTGLDMIQQVYGINLDWAGKPAAPGGATGATLPPSPTFLADTMPPNLSSDQQKAWRDEQAAAAARAKLAYGGSGGLLTSSAMYAA